MSLKDGITRGCFTVKLTFLWVSQVGWPGQCPAWGGSFRAEGRRGAAGVLCEGWPEFNTKTRGDPGEMVLLQRHDLSTLRCWSLWGYLLGYNVLEKKNQRKKMEKLKVSWTPV